MMESKKMMMSAEEMKKMSKKHGMSFGEMMSKGSKSMGKSKKKKK